jgi:DnaK suppressor protein
MKKKHSITDDSLSPIKFEPYKLKKGESYMNESQQEHFRSILLDWKREVSPDIDRTVDRMREETTRFADIADRATQEETFSLELLTKEREAKLLEKLEATLISMQAGEYGYCAMCGTEIGIHGLEGTT